MNRFKLGQKVECMVGTMKGEQMIVVAFLKNGMYSCQKGEKYYQYPENCLK